MKAEELLAVAVRISGVLVLFFTLRDIPYALDMISDIKDRTGESTLVYLQCAMIVSSLAAAAVMMKFPLTLSRLIFSPSTSDSPLLEERGEAIQIAGITIVGIYTLILSIPDVVASAVLFFSTRAHIPDAGLFDNQAGLRVVIGSMQIALGMVCLLGARGIVDLLRAVQR